jgi:hypothetical protein
VYISPCGRYTRQAVAKNRRKKMTKELREGGNGYRAVRGHRRRLTASQEAKGSQRINAINSIVTFF